MYTKQIVYLVIGSYGALLSAQLSPLTAGYLAAGVGGGVAALIPYTKVIFPLTMTMASTGGALRALDYYQNYSKWDGARSGGITGAAFFTGFALSRSLIYWYLTTVSGYEADLPIRDALGQDEDLTPEQRRYTAWLKLFQRHDLVTSDQWWTGAMVSIFLPPAAGIVFGAHKVMVK